MFLNSLLALFLLFFSNTFARLEITDIGQKLLREKIRPFLCIDVIIATLKICGILLCVIHKLKTCIKGLQVKVICFFRRLGGILSISDDEPFFNLYVASKTSLYVISSNLFREILL